MVVVFGSINLDLVTRVGRLPAPGETIAGSSFATWPGGKGANQALAAARARARVVLHGAVGRDAFADAALGPLASGGVDLAGVARVDAATGCATILVDDAGENCIAVTPGANALADPEAVPDSSLGRQALLVLQQEVPAAANERLLVRARRLGARTLLNAAPARPVALELLRALDLLVVNEAEAAALAASLGWPDAPEPFARAAVSVSTKLAVIVTLGARGAMGIGGERLWRVRAPSVAVADTTGAGDAFVGALAAALDRAEAFPDALRAAVAAGSLACTAHGAQSALPDRAATAALLPATSAESVEIPPTSITPSTPR